MYVVVLQSGSSQMEKSFSERAKSLLEEMNNFTKAPSTLKEYSSWLSAFQGSHYDQHLEIPGPAVDYSFHVLHVLPWHPVSAMVFAIS